MWASSAALAIEPEDRQALERIVRSGRSEQRHALRARIILGAEGKSNNALAKELGTPESGRYWNKPARAAEVSAVRVVEITPISTSRPCALIGRRTRNRTLPP